MTNNSFTSKLLSLSRRYAYVWYDGKITLGKIASNQSDYIIGDIVNCYLENNEVYVSGFNERKNILKRCYFDNIKNIACNIDKIFLVVSPKPMLNTFFVDNVIATANKEKIPVTIILNKCDLDISGVLPIIEIYKNLNITILKTSTKTLEGVEDLKNYFDNTSEGQVLFCGLSGVGKSSILNTLLGDEINKVGELGKRGGGKQTTTQAFGFHYNSKKRLADKKQDLFIIDLPGISNFTVSYLDKYEVSGLFTDINTLSKKCEYEDCLHINEPNCNVKDALENGTLSKSRYDSYVGIIESIEEARKY